MFFWRRLGARDKKDPTRALACSFCGKSAAEVEKLVAGPRVYICNRCVAVAAEIMAASGPEPPAAEHRPRMLGRILRRIAGLRPPRGGDVRRHAVAPGGVS